MVWINRITAILVLLAGVPLWRQAEAFPGTATTFPRVTLAIVATLAVIMLVTSFSRAHTSGPGEGEPGAAAMMRPLAVFAVAAAGIYLSRFSGFFVAMLALCAVLYPLLNVTRPRVYVIAVALLLVAVYLIFDRMLGVPLTGGSLWRG